MSDHSDELVLEDEEGEPEIVHWMAPRPVTVGLGGLSGAVAGAFVLGAATALGALLLMHWLDPARSPLQRRRSFF